MASVEDLKDGRVPHCLHWSDEDVAKFVGDLGYPYYSVSNEIV